jgi:hypothetical protein
VLLPVFVVVFVAWLAAWIALHWWLAGRVMFDDDQTNPSTPSGDQL